MKVLVTGAAGFVGIPLMAALARRGAEPVGLVRSTASATAAAPELDAWPLFEADYHAEAEVATVLEHTRPDALVHCAWRLEPGAAYLDDPANLQELRASLRLFERAADAGCRRFVGIGTCLEYAPSTSPVGEDAVLDPRTLYAAAKAALYLSASAWAHVVGADFAWARLYHPFGPREAPTRLVPNVIQGLLRGHRVATTCGTQCRSFAYIDDVGDALAAVTLSALSGPFNIASHDVLSVRELVERIAARLDATALLDVGGLPQRPGEPQSLQAKTSRLTSELGWQPQHGLDDALDSTIAWWRQKA